MEGRGNDSVHDAMRTEKTAGSRRRRLQSKPKANSSQMSMLSLQSKRSQCAITLTVIAQQAQDELNVFLDLLQMREENPFAQEAQKIQVEDTLRSEEMEDDTEHTLSSEEMEDDTEHTLRSEEMEDDTEHTLSSETEDEAPKYTLCVAPVKTQLYTIPVDIQAAEKPLKTVELTVDPGSAVSVLPRCVYEEHFKDVPLHYSTSVQRICSQGPMMEQGCMQATVHRNGVQVPAYFYVMDLGLGTTALMGRVLISALHLHIEA